MNGHAVVDWTIWGPIIASILGMLTVAAQRARDTTIGRSGHRELLFVPFAGLVTGVVLL